MKGLSENDKKVVIAVGDEMVKVNFCFSGSLFNNR